MTRRAVLLLAAALTLSLLLPAAGEAAGPPVRMRGTIEQFDHDKLTVKPDLGGTAVVIVTPKTNISAVEARKLSDIKPNDFIGVTAIPGKNGTLNATEVHIFPAALRGAGEGHYPFDRGPGSTMTNAVVSGMVKSGNGERFTLVYKTPKIGKPGESDISISPTIPIVAIVPGDQALLKPGAKLVMFAAKGADNTLTALAIIAEKDGVKPPM